MICVWSRGCSAAAGGAVREEDGKECCWDVEKGFGPVSVGNCTVFCEGRGVGGQNLWKRSYASSNENLVHV